MELIDELIVKMKFLINKETSNYFINLIEDLAYLFEKGRPFLSLHQKYTKKMNIKKKMFEENIEEYFLSSLGKKGSYSSKFKTQ